MLSLATFRASPRSLPISSTTGETMWHGTHHSAQKSTRTGVSDPRTVVWKSESPTEPMFAIVCAPSGVACSGSFAAFGAAPTGSQNVAFSRDIPRAGPLLSLLCEEALGVDRRLAALARRGHRLPVGVVGDVAGGEHARHPGLGRGVVHHDVPVVVDRELIAEQRLRRVVADGHEHAVRRDRSRLAGHHVARDRAG